MNEWIDVSVVASWNGLTTLVLWLTTDQSASASPSRQGDHSLICVCCAAEFDGRIALLFQFEQVLKRLYRNVVWVWGFPHNKTQTRNEFAP